MERYKIVRIYQNVEILDRVITKGATLEEAREHCKDPETSSTTCTKPAGKQTTRRLGPWFDGYTLDG